MTNPVPVPVPSAPTLAAPPPAMGKGTMSRQLVLRTTALVAIVTIVLSAFTALASFQILQKELDDRLAVAVGRPPRDLNGRGPDDISASGVIRIDRVDTAIRYTSDNELTEASLTELLAVPATGQPTTVRIEGLGLYRAVARTKDGLTTVVAMPFTEITKPMTSQLLMAGLLTAGAIGLSYAASRRVVERSLRPLNRLAATATHVSNLELERGEVQVPVRVAPADADPATEVGRVGQAFNHMLDNVEGALAARHRSETKVRQFVADASHELRNPLASIRGYAELTRRERQELPSVTAHALSRIESESDRMSALVEDLLLLARLDAGPTLDLQQTDLTEIVLNAVSDARAAGSEHEWALELPEEAVTARADAHRLHQVVVNLLANARTHTPPGTRVETSLRREGPWAVISVTDNGPGVPPEIRDTVFERFTRADASRVRREGASSTGLGLAIVAAVVGAHGGRVELHSVPGRTTFTVRVPVT